MKYSFLYNESPYFQIESMSVIGDFNGWNSTSNIAYKVEEDMWQTEIKLSPGEYRYKFLINDFIRLNDPSANIYTPGENSKLVSLFVINESGERMVNTASYTVNVEKYSMSGEVCESHHVNSKKSFDSQKDEKVVTMFEFTDVTGIHTVSVLWYKPDGAFHYMSEEVLYTPDGDEDKPIVLWFWIDIGEYQLPTGKWNFKLFIDGAFILDDYFMLRPSTYYVANGNLYFR